MQTPDGYEMAAQHYLAGRYDQARLILDDFLATNDNSCAAWNLSANLAHMAGDPQGAEAAYLRSLQLNPNYADAYYNLGNFLTERKRFAEAETSYQQALRINPNDADVFNRLGNLYREQKRPVDAETAYRQALQLHPDHINSCNNLGILLTELERFAEAEAAYRQALRINPNIALIHSNLGLLFKQQKRLADAEIAYREALRLMPNNPKTLHNLGILLALLNRPGEAEDAFRNALRIQPGFVDAVDSLGNVLHEQKRFAEAEAAYQEALRLDPHRALTHNNIANLYDELRRNTEAEAAYLEALRLDPDSADTRFNLSLFYISNGRLAEGWPLYEARFAKNKCNRDIFPIQVPFPMWQGEDLTGKSLLVMLEQGYGDQIQFCRYTVLLKARGVRHLTLVCSPPLATLMESLAGVDQLLSGHNRTFPPHDYWTFLLSVPLHMGTTLTNIPDEIPYLHAPPDRQTGRDIILAQKGLRAGLVWRGNPTHINDANRSVPDMRLLAPLWTVPNVTFFSLQKGHGEEEARLSPPGQPLIHLGGLIQDFGDTAAILSSLDLLITVDSAVGHLAGALGKPCWVMLTRSNTSWRWLHDQPDTAWYPRVMRLFRQTQVDGWAEVIQQMTEELKGWSPPFPRQTPEILTS
ncbi:MAG: tetratricopeptide repeat protein [Magnetococcales bacterium]|nr:tetratricopeptide repeat protein [Magnetococcales bacterium]